MDEPALKDGRVRLTPLHCVCHAPDAHDADETAHDRPTEGFKAIEDDDRKSTARDMPRHAARADAKSRTRGNRPHPPTRGPTPLGTPSALTTAPGRAVKYRLTPPTANAPRKLTCRRSDPPRTGAPAA